MCVDPHHDGGSNFIYWTPVLIKIWCTQKHFHIEKKNHGFFCFFSITRHNIKKNFYVTARQQIISSLSVVKIRATRHLKFQIQTFHRIILREVQGEIIFWINETVICKRFWWMKKKYFLVFGKKFFSHRSHMQRKKLKKLIFWGFLPALPIFCL